MDSKNIHIACSHMKGKIDWKRDLDNEWSFVGVGNHFKENEVDNFIKSFFQEDELYFVIDRHNSYSIARDIAAKRVKESLKEQSITLCDHSFSKMIEFHYIGVAKHGAIIS